MESLFSLRVLPLKCCHAPVDGPILEHGTASIVFDGERYKGHKIEGLGGGDDLVRVEKGK